MAKRKIITIDEHKCNGCGECIPNCPEGAIQIIDGKARLISDIFCDGLGACLGHCPQGAISIEEKEAEAYDEYKVMANVVKHGENTILAHLNHLREHGEDTYLSQALSYLNDHDITVDFNRQTNNPLHPDGCPGAKTVDFSNETTSPSPTGNLQSQLQQWPIKMHLISPEAFYFQKSDLLLAADCVAYSLGSFHQEYLSGKTLAIACPKLDSNREVYLQKLISLIDNAKINTLTIMTMQVPCCQGLVSLAQHAMRQANRNIPIKHIMVGIKGNIMKEEWI